MSDYEHEFMVECHHCNNKVSVDITSELRAALERMVVITAHELGADWVSEGDKFVADCLAEFDRREKERK